MRHKSTLINPHQPEKKTDSDADFDATYNSDSDASSVPNYDSDADAECMLVMKIVAMNYCTNDWLSFDAGTFYALAETYRQRIIGRKVLAETYWQRRIETKILSRK